jgi:hypothetical protein
MPFATRSSRFLLPAIAAYAVVVGGARAGHSQALSVERLSGGTSLVVVSQPLADATTLVWSETDEEGAPQTRRLVTGRLTLAADVEDAFGAAADAVRPAPDLVVAVGGGSPRELAEFLGRLLAGRPVERFPGLVPEPLVEGGLDRRLGPPGSEAQLRLEVQLPPASDWRRSSVEVLWGLAPTLLPDSVPPLASRIDGDFGVLEGRVDAEFAELTVRQIRLALARFASDPSLQEAAVAEARRRQQVRRQAALEEHPAAALAVFDRWRSGGEPAVREMLFGLAGVTFQSVRAAAADWLPVHPGRAQLTLPPRVFNPRFAVGPEIVRLGNDLSAAILERGAAPLSVICLRPVLVPDVDGSRVSSDRWTTGRGGCGCAPVRRCLKWPDRPMASGN